MRIFSIFRKNLLETLRDWKILLMTLTLAPLFVFALYGFFGTDSQPLKVLVINNDLPVKLTDGTVVKAGAGIIEELNKLKNPDGTPQMKLTTYHDSGKAKAIVAEGKAQLLMVIPENLSRAIGLARQGNEGPQSDLVFYGDITNQKYMLTAVFANSTAFSYIDAVVGNGKPVGLKEIALGNAGKRTEFEFYVPGLLVFAMIMVLFPAALAVVKEIDQGTIRRLKLSGMNPAELLGAISITQVLLSIVALFITLMAAVSLGFRVGGSILDLIIIGVISSFAVIAIGLITAAFCRNANDVLTIGNLPFFLIMFFSGMMFPVPEINLFRIGSHAFHLNDVLPPTHTMVAMNKILNYNAGLKDLGYEIGAILALTVLYFAAGVWLFNRRHLRARG